LEAFSAGSRSLRAQIRPCPALIGPFLGSWSGPFGPRFSLFSGGRFWGPWLLFWGLRPQKAPFSALQQGLVWALFRPVWALVFGCFRPLFGRAWRPGPLLALPGPCLGALFPGFGLFWGGFWLLFGPSGGPRLLWLSQGLGLARFSRFSALFRPFSALLGPFCLPARFLALPGPWAGLVFPGFGRFSALFGPFRGPSGPSARFSALQQGRLGAPGPVFGPISALLGPPSGRPQTRRPEAYSRAPGPQMYHFSALFGPLLGRPGPEGPNQAGSYSVFCRRQKTL